MIAFPLIALIANYYLNIKYMMLWNIIDPEKPEDEETLTKEEILAINESDEHFDTWNGKYYQVAGFVRKCVIFISHKFFQFPYTHFFGYIHCTLRTQDFRVRWQWEAKEVEKWLEKRSTHTTTKI